MKKDFKAGGKVPRTERLNSELKREIYEIITRKLNDPFITEMVSVTRVEVSRDLSYAKVFVSVYSTDAEKKKRTFTAVKDDAKKIRFALASSMRTRTVPELEFIDDDSMEYGDKMDKLFAKIRKENGGKDIKGGNDDNA
ncbi:MAG: 30S ribosome-binding factor RbfA [Clostridia bacterium]|nr:30S ribosome-binding factor RbfA [Clostridia bacterium]